MDSVYGHRGSGMKEQQAVDVEGVAGPGWCSGGPTAVGVVASERTLNTHRQRRSSCEY